MKIAVVSDIHGNLPALDAVLADIARQGVDVIVNLGDIVSGPLWAAATADRLMALNLPTIAGNHERQVLMPPASRMSESDAHAAAELRSEHREWLASLPATLQLSDEVFCCHGTPTSDLVYFMETPVAGFKGAGLGFDGVRVATLPEMHERAGDAMKGIAHGVILCGHTHIPRTVRLGDGRLIVNPGSVGLPGFDDDHPHPHIVETHAPHARYALLDRSAAGFSVSLRAVAYDWEAAARRAELEHRPDWAEPLRTGFVLRNANPKEALMKGTGT
jgi:predicted phosphodiesterase